MQIYLSQRLRETAQALRKQDLKAYSDRNGHLAEIIIYASEMLADLQDEVVDNDPLEDAGENALYEALTHLDEGCNEIREYPERKAADRRLVIAPYYAG